MKSIIDYTNKLKSFFAEKQALANEVEARATLGAHNLLKNQNYTHVVSGVTFTLNDDGSWTLNGTASGEIYFYLFETTDSSQYPLKQGTRYKISGCPNGGSLTSSYRLLVTMGSSNFASDIGSGAEFTAPAWNTGYHVYINVVKNQVLNNLRFYPMIRLATDTDPTYQPYAMTNQQLTSLFAEKGFSDTVPFTPVSGVSYQNGCRYCKIGCFVFIIINVKFDSPPTDASIFVLPQEVRPLDFAVLSAMGGESYNAKANVIINSAGYIHVTSVDKYVTATGFYLV